VTHNINNYKSTSRSPKQPSLKVNAVSNWFALGVNIVVGFLLTPFIISNLGKIGYGIWTLVGSFIGYYGLLNLGVSSAVMRYIARYAGQEDVKSLNGVASTAFAMFCCTGTLAIVVSFIIADPLARFFEVEPQYFDDFKYVIWIIGFVIGLSFPSNVFESIVRAHEKFVAVNTANIALTLTRAGMTVCLLLSGAGLLGVAVATLITELVHLVVSFLLCRFLTPSVRVNFAFARLRVLRMLITYGSITTVIVIADIMRGNIDSIVIGKWVNLPAVGVYGIAVIITRYIVRLVTAGMDVLTPRFATLDGKGDHAQVRRLLVKALAISSFLSFGGYMMAIIIGKQFILWWIGKDFVDAAVILWILSISDAFAIAQNPAIGFMYALNKHHFYAIATIIEAIANLTLSIILVYRYGIVGVALGTMIPMLIIKILVMPVYVSKIAGISLREYIRPMLPSAIVATVLTLTAYHIGIVTKDTAGIGNLVCVGMIAGALYVTVYFMVALKQNSALFEMFTLRTRSNC
jgi:O-antigen/teichoic acid export membrane protein